MAYKDGIWSDTFDRNARKAREARWQGAEREAAKPGAGKHESDLDRAMRQDRGDSGLDRDPLGLQVEIDRLKKTEPESKRSPHGSTLGLGLGAGAGFPKADRVNRPTIAGGCNHDGHKGSITLSKGGILYPAMAHKIQDASHLDLIIDCAGLLQGRKFIKSATAPRYRALNLVAWPDVITLAWPDMTAPTQIGIRFWSRLLDLLPAHTAVCCMGGHGRTGTCLAALLVADGVGGKDAIARVRAEHCPRAIETVQQEDYIKGLAQALQGRGRGK